MHFVCIQYSNPKSLHGENDGKNEQKSQKINKQKTLSHCEPVEGTKPKHPHSDYESMVSVSVCVCVCVCVHVTLLCACAHCYACK